MSTQRISELIQLSHDIGREDRNMAILAEGNTSARLGPDQFAVKASGRSLATLTESDLTVCVPSKILPLIERKTLGDEIIEKALLEARADSSSLKPSAETVFHAWLLSLEGVEFVGHCHPVAVNQVLCSPRARDFAEQRMFPDEIVCCGPASVFVPYADPGLPLAREIRERVNQFIKAQGCVPRLILLQNHGLIALGASSRSVMACILMAEKAARIFVGAAALGGPNFLKSQQVDRISTRPDEAYRRRQLRI